MMVTADVTKVATEADLEVQVTMNHPLMGEYPAPYADLERLRDELNQLHAGSGSKPSAPGQTTDRQRTAGDAAAAKDGRQVSASV